MSTSIRQEQGMLARAESTHAALRWMAPTAALTQLRAPVESESGGHLEREELARYGFRVGSLGLLIPPRVNSEALKYVKPARLPRTAAGLLGIINLRGTLVPVFELLEMFGLTDRDRNAQRSILVLGKGADAVGVLIDGFPVALQKLSLLRTLPQLPAALERHVSAGYATGDSVWLDFDHGSFFASWARGRD
jgi:chemotaxis signal transduction protein